MIAKLEGHKVLNNHCLRRSDTQRIDLSAKAHHDWRAGSVSIGGVHYPNPYVKLEDLKVLRRSPDLFKDIENLAIILVPLIMILSRGHTGQIKG